MIQDVEIRQATAEDIKHFYPDGSPRTVYAWIAFYKERPACLAGVIIERGGAIPFSDVIPDLDAPKITVWRTVKELFELIKSLQLPLITSTPKRSKFLERVGFTHVNTCQGQEIYECRG